jgi:hypothetical protein
MFHSDLIGDGNWKDKGNFLGAGVEPGAPRELVHHHCRAPTRCFLVPRLQDGR